LGQDGSGNGVYAQRYDAQGNAVGLKLTGTAGADVLNLDANTLLTVDGAGGNDVITGGTSNDNLFGGSGNDTLIGGDGDDRLDGGTGSDKMTGGNGGDTYVVDAPGDSIAESGSGGSDMVLASIGYTLGATLENLTLTGTGNIDATGNATGNLILGNSGDNLIDGKAGSDIMAGQGGNDTYVVDNLFDIVVENAGQGADTVKSSVSFSLDDNIEDLVLLGALNIDGTGNGLDNHIAGNTGNNILAGGDGIDTIHAMAGNDTVSGGNGADFLFGEDGKDTLTGGAGADHFAFNTKLAPANVDHIVDFVPLTDVLDLSTSIFTNAGLAGALSGSEFLSSPGSVSATSTQHILYNNTTGELFYNADGAGAGAPVLVAVLDTHPALTNTDIHLV
jgi:Ca2+-binding RTX toxin-like protein